MRLLSGDDDAGFPPINFFLVLLMNNLYWNKNTNKYLKKQTVLQERVEREKDE